jgi:hypothetical protein
MKSKKEKGKSVSNKPLIFIGPKGIFDKFEKIEKTNVHPVNRVGRK